MSNDHVITPTGTTVAHPSGKSIIKSLKQAAIRFVIAVPDIVTSEGLLWPIARERDFNLIRICKEDEGVSICAAMSYSDTRAILLMQQTGLMDSLNAVRAIAMDYRLPVCMMVGLQGKEPNRSPPESDSYGVRIIEPVLQAMTIPYRLIEEPDDVTDIARDIDRAYRNASPFCFLIGRSPLP